jgi:hypothetical protein
MRKKHKKKKIETKRRNLKISILEIFNLIYILTGNFAFSPFGFAFSPFGFAFSPFGFTFLLSWNKPLSCIERLQV